MWQTLYDPSPLTHTLPHISVFVGTFKDITHFPMCCVSPLQEPHPRGHLLEQDVM